MSRQPSVSGSPAASGLDLYRMMNLIRCFEEQVGRRFAQGQLPGFVHLSIGQEAVAVGICSALQQEDWITTTHRGHGHVVAKGANLRKLAAELYGSEDGACRGLGGSMHLVDIEAGVLCAGAIVGGTIPLAAGAALTFAQQNKPFVAVSFFGDGAVNQGVFHETLNIAALWRLPVVFACENNGYAEFTSVGAHSSASALINHGTLHGIASFSVDGNDVEAVRKAALAAVLRARAGDGPILLECRTYRWRGHYEGDPQKYKPVGDEDPWKERDPITVLGGRLLERSEASEEDLAALRKQAATEVEEAFAGLASNNNLSHQDLELLTYAAQPRTHDGGGLSWSN